MLIAALAVLKIGTGSVAIAPPSAGAPTAYIPVDPSCMVTTDVTVELVFITEIEVIYILLVPLAGTSPVIDPAVVLTPVLLKNNSGIA
jgi:hypothetical protein